MHQAERIVQAHPSFHTAPWNNCTKYLDNFKEAVDSPKSCDLMGYFCPKNTFLQLKHYIQKIYPTLLSTTCVKIQEMTDVIFETISYFPRHSPCILFSSNITHTFYKSNLSK